MPRSRVRRLRQAVKEDRAGEVPDQVLDEIREGIIDMKGRGVISGGGVKSGGKKLTIEEKRMRREKAKRIQMKAKESGEKISLSDAYKIMDEKKQTKKASKRSDAQILQSQRSKEVMRLKNDRGISLKEAWKIYKAAEAKGDLSELELGAGGARRRKPKRGGARNIGQMTRTSSGAGVISGGNTCPLVEYLEDVVGDNMPMGEIMEGDMMDDDEIDEIYDSLDRYLQDINLDDTTRWTILDYVDELMGGSVDLDDKEELEKIAEDIMEELYEDKSGLIDWDRGAEEFIGQIIYDNLGLKYL